MACGRQLPVPLHAGDGIAHGLQLTLVRDLVAADQVQVGRLGAHGRSLPRNEAAPRDGDRVHDPLRVWDDAGGPGLPLHPHAGEGRALGEGGDDLVRDPRAHHDPLPRPVTRRQLAESLQQRRAIVSQAVVLRLVREPLQLQPASILASRRREALPRVGAGQALLHGELPHESGERVIDRGVAHPIRPLTSAVTSATMKSQRCAAARAKPLPACA
ncbi:hypothetical protein G6F63_013693 [Rhizopus arrhizus]|nr:hypothetical protein G6F63_013693 [Rhizopus arrhizus]